MKIELDHIYNMDCLEGMKQIPDGSVDLVVTSPPYDNLRKYGGAADDWNFDKFTQIAQQLAIDQVFTWSNEGDLVLDPFMGSGTTAVACIKEKRHYIGFELNEEYYRRSLQRVDAVQRQLTLF